MNGNYQEAINICWECRNVCQKTLYNHCLTEGGAHIEQAHIKLMTDCIQICQVAADFMTRGSGLHEEVCMACAKICLACAESCESIGGAAMLDCALKCRACAESCQNMSKFADAEKFVTA